MANGASVSGFYGLRQRSNGQLAFVGGPGPDAATVAQRVDGAFAQAGVITSYAPSERTGLTFNYVWAQTDYEHFFFSTNIRRYDSVTSVTAITFTPRKTLRSIIDTHTLSLNGDVRATERVTLSTYYTLTAARGDVANGVILGGLPVPDAVTDDTFHTLAVSVDYLLKTAWTFRTTYAFDYFSDDAYESLTGGRNMLVAGLVFGF
jgi:phage terminase large subunit-like protein